MGLGKVIAWGFLAFILTGWLVLVIADLVYGIAMHHLNTYGPPAKLAIGLLLLFMADAWVIRKLRIAYARYKFEKVHR
jgi:hypothetical protein